MFKLTCVCKVWQEEPVGWRRRRQHEDNETTAHISGHREGITKLRVGKRNAGCWLGRRGGWKLGCGCASCVSFFIRLNFADACALAADCHHSSFPDNDILKPNKNTSCMNLTGHTPASLVAAARRQPQYNHFTDSTRDSISHPEHERLNISSTNSTSYDRAQDPKLRKLYFGNGSSIIIRVGEH